MSSGKIDKSQMIEQTKFAYYSFGKVFEKQDKTFKDLGKNQIIATEEHGKQLAEANVLD